MADNTRCVAAVKNAVVEAALGHRVAVVMPGHNSAREILNQIVDLALDLNIQRVDRSHGRYCIEFDGGGTLRVLTPARGGRGWTADLLYVHETVPESITAELPPMLSPTAGEILRFG